MKNKNRNHVHLSLCWLCWLTPTQTVAVIKWMYAMAQLSVEVERKINILKYEFFILHRIPISVWMSTEQYKHIAGGIMSG